MNNTMLHLNQIIKKHNLLYDRIQNMKRVFGSVELYPSEIHTLVYIHDHSADKFSDIAGGMSITKGALTRLVNKIEAKGLVRRYKKKEDQKAIYFEVTASGKESCDAHEAFHRQFDFEISETFQKFLAEHGDTINLFLDHTDQLIDQLDQAIDAFDMVEKK